MYRTNVCILKIYIQIVVSVFLTLVCSSLVLRAVQSWCVVPAPQASSLEDV